MLVFASRASAQLIDPVHGDPTFHARRRFARARKYELDSAVKTVLNHHEFMREFGWGHTPAPDRMDAIENVLASGFFSLLPFRDPRGRRILVMRPGLVDRARAPMLDAHYVLWLLLEKILANDDVTQACGIVLLQSLAGTRIRDIDRDSMKRGTRMLEKCVPMRQKGMTIIHPPWYMAAMVAIVRPFLSQKARERLTVCNSEEALFAIFPRAIIPSFFGGEYAYDNRHLINALRRDAGLAPVPMREPVVLTARLAAPAPFSALARLDEAPFAMLVVREPVGQGVVLGMLAGDVIEAVPGVARVRSMADLARVQLTPGAAVTVLRRVSGSELRSPSLAELNTDLGWRVIGERSPGPLAPRQSDQPLPQGDTPKPRRRRCRKRIRLTRAERDQRRLARAAAPPSDDEFFSCESVGSSW